MKNSKKTVRGLKTELFKKYQTDPKVANPSTEINSLIGNLPSISLADIAEREEQKRQEEMLKPMEPLKLNRYPVYSEEEKAKMKKAFGLTSEDLYKRADVLGTRFPKLPSSSVTTDQTLAASEYTTGTDKFIKDLQSKNTLITSTLASLPEDIKNYKEEKKKKDDKSKNSFDWRTAVRLGVAGIGAGLSLRDDIENRDAMNRRIQARNDIPRFMPNEYTNMGRPGSTQIIYASHGAEIRTGTNTGAEEAELERGEYFILPDGESYVVGGKKHSQGGEKFILPDGTIVFSDYLKIPGTNTTFAQEARKYDLDKYEDVLQNPHAKSVDRNTAQIMFERNSRKLQELFQLQQSLNGDSNGELKTEREGKKGMFYGQVGGQKEKPFRYNRSNKVVNLRPTAPEVVFPSSVDPRFIDYSSIKQGIPYEKMTGEQYADYMSKYGVDITKEEQKNAQVVNNKNTPPFKINRGFRNLRPTPAEMVFRQQLPDEKLLSAPGVTDASPAVGQFLSSVNRNAPGSVEEMSSLQTDLAAQIESSLDNLGITDVNAREQFKSNILNSVNTNYGVSRTPSTSVPFTPTTKPSVSIPFGPTTQGIKSTTLVNEPQPKVELTVTNGVSSAVTPITPTTTSTGVDAKVVVAANDKPNQGSVTGAKTEPQVQTTSWAIGATNATSAESGTVTKDGNASKPTSTSFIEIVDKNGNKRSIYVEDQGDQKGKTLRQQYEGDIWKLVRNRLNENYDELSTKLIDSYEGQLKNKNLKVGKVEDLVTIMEGGNNALVRMRDYFKGSGQEERLFDINLDLSGKDGQNAAQQKTVELFKDYIGSAKFAEEVKTNPALLNGFPWIKGKIVKSGDRYTLEGGAMDTEFVEKYQAAYRAFGVVKKQQPKGKGDMLRGFRIAPEGLADHQWMGLPISPVDLWGGNTTIGQISAWEDEEPPAKKKTEEPGEEVLKTSEGGDYNTKVGNAPTGAYEKAPFDIAQLAPEFYGLANAEIFPYMLPDITAPYVMPQTLNIQPQLQDVDNSYVAALRAGADPNAAFISTLNAKQKLYSEKQNYDAQQRAQADVTNASYRWQEDVQDMQSLDRVYNTLIAAADDARTSQIQDIVRSASNKRAVFNAEEARKKLYIDNFVRNYTWDGKTGEAKLVVPEGYDPLNLASIAYSMYNPDAQKQTTTTTKSEAAKPSTTTTSTTYVSPGYTPAKKKNEKQVTSKDKNK